MKTLHILKSNSLCWHLFGIDKKSKLCYYICIDKNQIVLRQLLTIDKARSIWKDRERNGYFPQSEEDALSSVITSHLRQRIKEFNQWKRGEVKAPFQSNYVKQDSIEKLQLIERGIKTGSWFEYQAWLHEKQEFIDDQTEDDEVSTVTIDTIEDQTQLIDDESGDDIDNYWNKEGIFEQSVNQYPDEDEIS